MKILYVSDVHEEYGKLNKVEEFRKDSNPDIFMISGDILDRGTGDEMLNRYFNSLRAEIAYYLQRNFGIEDFAYPEQYLRSLPDIARWMKDDKDGLKRTKRLAESYLKVLDKIEGELKKKYKKLTKIVSPEFLILPGNYDLDMDKVNKKRNLHKRVKNIKGFKIAGYGSANNPWLNEDAKSIKEDLKKALFYEVNPSLWLAHAIMASQAIIPFDIPGELTVPFFEQTDEKGRVVKSEAKRFFEQRKPDIAFTHMPPRGLRDIVMRPEELSEMIKKGILINPDDILQDKGIASDKRDYYSYLKNEILFSPNGEFLKRQLQQGSLGLREYLEQGFTKLLCCGHVHECIGVESLHTEKGVARVFNGGSLVDGYFSEITLNDKTKDLESIIIYQLTEKEGLIIPGRGKVPTELEVKPVEEYHP